ncbi:hypothetical protein EJB05_51431, partial [Eragrostis curvula]
MSLSNLPQMSQCRVVMAPGPMHGGCFYGCSNCTPAFGPRCPFFLWAAEGRTGSLCCLRKDNSWWGSGTGLKEGQKLQNHQFRWWQAGNQSKKGA